MKQRIISLAQPISTKIKIELLIKYHNKFLHLDTGFFLSFFFVFFSFLFPVHLRINPPVVSNRIPERMLFGGPIHGPDNRFAHSLVQRDFSQTTTNGSCDRDRGPRATSPPSSSHYSTSPWQVSLPSRCSTRPENPSPRDRLYS